MYPLHSFSPYNKGKACSRDSVSHSCNSLILREKTVYPYTLFPLILREKTVYPYTLFPLIIRGKTVYPYTLLMQTLNCILNCNLGTTASQEGLHLEKTVYPYTLFSLILREKTVYPYTLFPLIIRGKTVYPYTLLMQTLNCILNCNLGTTASQEGLHLEKTVYPYTLLTSQYTVFKRKKAY